MTSTYVNFKHMHTFCSIYKTYQQVYLISYVNLKTVNYWFLKPYNVVSFYGFSPKNIIYKLSLIIHFKSLLLGKYIVNIVESLLQKCFKYKLFALVRMFLVTQFRVFIYSTKYFFQQASFSCTLLPSYLISCKHVFAQK